MCVKGRHVSSKIKKKPVIVVFFIRPILFSFLHQEGASRLMANVRCSNNDAAVQTLFRHVHTVSYK